MIMTCEVQSRGTCVLHHCTTIHAGVVSHSIGELLAASMVVQLPEESPRLPVQSQYHVSKYVVALSPPISTV
eukprot:m.172495 g.172495  ORF g.172495 m.172495 type:complete len:72 (-) comp18287_c0_seq3:224-439(-)